MEQWICQTCGTQFTASERPPATCPICCDERQYIGYKGQQWTTLAQMRQDGLRNEFREHEPGLIGIGTKPSFAIGERALLVQHPQGNILWDCMSLIDDETVAEIKRLGGLSAIAISHPHYYSTGCGRIHCNSSCTDNSAATPDRFRTTRLKLYRSASALRH